MINLKKIIVISFRFQLRAQIHHLIFFHGRDFLFESEVTNFNMYAHVIDSKTKGILLRNEADKPIKISRNFRFERVIELDYSNAYQVSADVMNLTIKHFEQSHQKIYYQRLLRVCLSAETKFFEEESEPIVRITNDIIIHNSDSVFTKSLIKLIKNYSVIWTNQSFATLFEKKWMRIPLRKNPNFKVKATVYFLKARDRELVDQTFDELHRKDRLE